MGSRVNPGGIEVVRDPKPVVCRRCAGTALLSVTWPAPWSGPMTEDIDPVRTTVLCPRCDVQDPAALPLLALFAVQDTVTDEHFDEFADEIRAWVTAVTTRRVTAAELDEEIAMWERGEM